MQTGAVRSRQPACSFDQLDLARNTEGEPEVVPRHRPGFPGIRMVAGYIQYTLLQALSKKWALEARVQVFRDRHPDEQTSLRPRPSHVDIQRTDVLVESRQEHPALLAIQVPQSRDMAIVASVRQNSF